MATPVDIPKDHRFIDLTGKTFGRWTVLFYLGKTKNMTMWQCRCACGTERFISVSNLRSGMSRSCGCLKSEMISQRSRTHGMGQTVEYSAWIGLRDRCNNPKNSKWIGYGGRGIKVCERWQTSFENFYEDMGPRPSRRHSVGRRDNDGDYDPHNCSWETPEEQRVNTRRNVHVEWNGQRMILADAIRLSGLAPKLVDNRLRRGWSLERALTQSASHYDLHRAKKKQGTTNV